MGQAAEVELDLVALAIPAFLLLVVVEAAIGWFGYGRRVTRFNAATADIATGISNQLVEMFTKVGFFTAYAWLYERRWIDLGEDSTFTVIVALFAVDFAYYWWHRKSHESNLMWAAHAVHHQSEDYNLAVALRQAWFTGVTSFPFYLPLALLGISPMGYAVAMGVNLLYQFWIHTELIDRLGPFEWVFNTPSHHRVHHGVNPQYLDKNHAGILIVWDRVFGTFEPEVESPVYGTTTALRSFSPVWANLEHLVHTARLARAAKRPGERWYAWIAHPAWRPQGWSKPVSDADLSRKVYDPQPARGVVAFVLGQQATVFAATFATLVFAHTATVGWAVFATITIITATVVWCAMLEGKAYARGLGLLWTIPWAILVGTGLPVVLSTFGWTPEGATVFAWSMGAGSSALYAAWAAMLTRASPER